MNPDDFRDAIFAWKDNYNSLSTSWYDDDCSYSTSSKYWITKDFDPRTMLRPTHDAQFIPASFRLKIRVAPTHADETFYFERPNCDNKVDVEKINPKLINENGKEISYAASFSDAEYSVAHNTEAEEKDIFNIEEITIGVWDYTLDISFEEYKKIKEDPEVATNYFLKVKKQFEKNFKSVLCEKLLKEKRIAPKIFKDYINKAISDIEVNVSIEMQSDRFSKYKVDENEKIGVWDLYGKQEYTELVDPFAEIGNYKENVDIAEKLSSEIFYLIEEMGDRYKDNVEDYHECIRSLLQEIGRPDIARIYAERVDEAFNDRQMERLRATRRLEAAE